MIFVFILFIRYVCLYVCMFVCNNVVRRSIHSYRIGKIIFPESDLLLPNENKISYRRRDQPWVSDGNVEIIVRNFTSARVVGWTFYYSQRAGPYPRRVFSH
jgi:hypothetical protein